MRVGLFFGSFNPVHVGHMIIANHVAQFAEVDKVWFVVSPQNPFKNSEQLLNEYDRFHLVQLAVDGNPQLAASNIEFSLPKPSYTIDTLTYLEEKYPEYSFSIILGSDGFQNLDKWKNSDLLCSRYPFIVYERPGFKIVPKPDMSITVVEAPLLSISATYIRNNIQLGKSIQYLVPDAVFEEMNRGGYYKKKLKES